MRSPYYIIILCTFLILLIAAIHCFENNLESDDQTNNDEGYIWLLNEDTNRIEPYYVNETSASGQGSS